jgi:hypothetical protein
VDRKVDMNSLCTIQYHPVQIHQSHLMPFFGATGCKIPVGLVIGHVRLRLGSGHVRLRS